MKSSTRLLALVLAMAGIHAASAQPAEPDQIDAARQYLRTGRFSTNRPSSRPTIRTNDPNAVRPPSVRNSIRYGTKPRPAQLTPTTLPSVEGSLTPDQERDARRMLQELRYTRSTPTPLTPSVPPPGARAVMVPEAAPVIPAEPPVAPPVVTATTPFTPPTVVEPPPVTTTPPPAVTPAPSVVVTPPRVVTPPPAVAVPPAFTPPAVTAQPPPGANTAPPPLNPEAAARELLEQQRMLGDASRAEAMAVQQEIKDAQNAQTLREQTMKAQEEAERMKEIARIEAEVLKAKARREGREGLTPPTAVAPPVTSIPTEPPPVTTPPPTAAVPPPAVVPPPATLPPPAAVTEPVATETVKAPTSRSVRPETVPPSAAALPLPGRSMATLTPEMEMKAREVLERQMSGLSSTPTTPMRSAPVAPTDPVVRPPAATPSARSEAQRRAAAEAQAREEAMRWEKAQQQQVKPGATIEPPRATTTPEVPSTPPAFSPTGKTKQERLTQLLNAYKSDQITAGQYHAERARIIAEP